MWIGNGTTASVGMIIYGEDSYSDMIVLNDSSFQKSFFSRGSINTFTVSLPRRLGSLYKVKVWHDNSGESPGWFLQDLVITELETEEKWYFLTKRWLAVEKGKGDIEVELKTSTKKEISSFKNLFHFRASKQLADGHLWISVFAKPPQSPFTRTQRLSCCMSVVFLAMVTNAMFYDFGQKARDTFQIGPLTMSWTQVKIGIQSALIALPVNVFILTVFRNVKPKTTLKDHRELEEENSPKGLPHVFIYVAWVLCSLAIPSSAFFTVLYSLQWGANISNEWLTSVLISFLQDVFILQPVQIAIISSLLSIIIRKPLKHDPVRGLPHRKNPCHEDTMVLPPEKDVLETSRKFWIKLRKMFRSVREISFFLIFVILLFVVCYGNRDVSRYHLRRSVGDIFNKSGEVRFLYYPCSSGFLWESRFPIGHCVELLVENCGSKLGPGIVFLELTMPLSTQEYKQVPTNYRESLIKCLRHPCDRLAYCTVESSKVVLGASCDGNWDKLRLDGPL